LNGKGKLGGKFSELFNGGAGFPSFMCATFKTNDPSADQRPETFCGESRGGVWSQAGSAYNQKWFNYIKTAEEYLSSHNLLDKAYYYFANEPQNKDDYDAIAWYSQQLKKAAPGLKLMVSEEPRSEIYDNAVYPKAKVDIWLPVLHNYEPELSWERERDYNEDTWIYFLHGTSPPYFNPITLDHEGVESKFTGWFLWKYRIRGIAYYSVNGWSQNPWTEPMTYGQNGNTFLLYPPSENNGNIDYGSNAHRMVPSIRLELLRDGLEDYEYLYALAGGNPEVDVNNEADQQANKIISGLTAYNRDPEFMYNLRRLIGLKNGGEISSIPDISPQLGHWRTHGAPADYYINFQNPDGSPGTSEVETIDGETYKYVELDGIKYLQIGTEDYSEKLGYGWYASNDVNWVMSYDEWFEGRNDLEKSYIYSDWGRKATFEFDLPSGNYDVTVSIGKRKTYSNQNVAVEGITVFENESTSDECKTKTVNVTVADSKLTVAVGDGNDYTFLNYMSILSTGQTTAATMQLDEAEFSAYPNPVEGSLTIDAQFEGRQNIHASILDVTGKEILLLEKGKMNRLHKTYYVAEKLAEGAYILQIVSEESVRRKKILIK